MHSATWQTICGFYTDIYESLQLDQLSMQTIFQTICQHKGERYALWMENGKKQQLTFDELPDRCASAAYQLDMLLPEKSGVVALHLPNSAMWPVIFWGILMSGHVPLLLNAAIPLQRFKPLLAATKAIAVISNTEDEGAIAANQVLQSNISADIAVFEDRWADQVLFMTSGTSGTPKLLVYNGLSLAKQIQSCRYFYRETMELAYPKSNGSLKQLALLPFSHIFGFVICVIWYPSFGRQIAYSPTLRPDDVLSTCNKLHVTHFCAVPSYFEMIQQIIMRAAKGLFGKNADDYLTYLNRGILPKPELYQKYQSYNKKLCAYTLGGCIRYMISGGGMLHPMTAGFFNRLGLYFCNGYGMTELGILCVEKSRKPEKRMQATIGIPSYGASFEIDEKGELWIDCDFAAAGYWDNGSVIPLPRPFPTRDMAHRLPDGRYMLLGRSDDLIIDSDGNRIHPTEIEERIRRIPAVTNVCVIHHDRKNIAFLEAVSTDALTAISEGINKANREMPLSHNVLEAWILTGLPRSSKGDVDRKKMEAQYAAGIENAVAVPLVQHVVHEPLTDTLVTPICKKVAELLSISESEVLPEASLFTELGMDSLAYMCLVQWLEEQYQMPFARPDQQRFESIAQCVEYIQNGRF